MNRSRVTIVALTLAVGLAAVGQAYAQPGASADPTKKDDASQPTPSGASLDPAFDPYVNLNVLATAWRNQDSDAMTDVALQLIHGEKILQRPHKKLPAAQAAELAAQMAIESRKPDALDRLIRGAKNADRAELAASLGAHRKLAAASRDGETPSVNLEDLTADQLILVKNWLSKVRTVKLAGDAEAMKEIQKQLEAAEGIPPAQKKMLQSLIAAELKTLGAAEGGETPAGKVFGKLSGASRPGPGTPVREAIIVPGGGGGGHYSSVLQATFVIQGTNINGFNVQAARLTSDPGFNSPLNQLGLRRGDYIIRLDGLPCNNYFELDNHFAQTTVRYARAGTGGYQDGSIYINTAPPVDPFGGGGGGAP